MLKDNNSHILIITSVFPPEPVVSAKLSYDIANALSVSNTVSVISPKPSRPFGFEFTGSTVHFNFNHIQVDSLTCASPSIIGRFRESYSFGKQCYKHIVNNHKNINIIYANTWALFGQYYVVKAAKKFNIPVVIHVQDIYPESLSNKMTFLRQLINLVWLPIDKYVLRNANMIIAISEKMKNYLVSTRNLESTKIAVVQNWQDEELFIKYNSQKEKTVFTFMYLGNIGPVAGVDLLIDAFNKTKINNCRLVIAGAGSMKESLEKKTKEKGNANIEFWSVPDGKVPDIQNCADIMILPIKKGSASSSVPSKLPAYMLSAKPIIGCVDEDSDTAAAIKEAKCGWVIPPDNTEMLAALMLSIVTSPTNNIKAFGINGRNYSIANYSKRNNLAKLIGILDQIIPSSNQELINEVPDSKTC